MEVYRDPEPEWKQQLRARFEQVVAGLESPPEGWEELGEREDEEGEEEPSLYRFYEELAALRNEYRKGNRRTAETFSQFGETLGGLDQEIRQLRRHLQTMTEKEPASDDFGRTHGLALVELGDRVRRLEAQLAAPPEVKEGFFSKTPASWLIAWDNVREAAEILANHFKGLLDQLGLQPIKALGQPFDPTLMKAVAREESAEGAPNIVTEELADGYLYEGKPLRLAEVKVSAPRESN